MTAQLDLYLSALAAAIRSELGDMVVAILAGGSLALDDFHTHTSDVDIALVVRAVPTHDRLAEFVRRIDHTALPCPAKGLDLIAFSHGSVGRSPPLPHAVFGFVTGRVWTSQLTGPEESADFLIDLFVLRESGRAVYGPPPTALIGRVPQELLRPLVANVIEWHRDRVHDSFHDPTGAGAVLNTCRAWRFASDGIMGSKTEGGRWAQERAMDATVIGEALAVRHTAGQKRLPRTAVLEFLTRVAGVVDEETAQEANWKDLMPDPSAGDA